jgi:glycosyltransferase involved in cell wall biosynthesis
MKQILMITTSYPDAAFAKGQEAAGGFVSDFAESLAQFAHVTVIAPSGRSTVETVGNLTTHRFAVPSLPLSLLRLQKPHHWSKIMQTLRYGQQAVMHACETNSFDHIFALWALPSGYWARTASKEHGIPYSIWALGSDIWTLGKVPIIKNVLRSVLRESRYRFADGFVLANDVQSLTDMDCQFLPSSRKFAPTKTKTLSTTPPYRFAFLGRWHPNKGIDLLLDSLTRLIEADWEQIEAVQVCGGGLLEEKVKTAVSHLQQNGRPITLKGYLNKEEAAELFTWADYVLLPSRIESIPVVFSDAVQTQCPIISMPIGDLPRLINTLNVGVLAASITAASFTQAIQNALSHSPALFEPGLAQAAREFSIEQSAKSFVALI